MTVALPVARGSSIVTSPTWETFLGQRADLTSRMHLEVCNGCDGCGLRCMDGFTVTQPEWEAAKAYVLKADPREVARVARQEKTVPWPGAEDTGATVTYCRFRDMENDRCSVYSARPTICRLFGQVSWLPCPIDAVPEYPADGAAVWNEYRRFERRTFAEWEKADAE